MPPDVWIPVRLCLALFAVGFLSLSGPIATVGAEGGVADPKAVREVLADLAARDPETRTQALAHLASLISIDASVGREALPRLKAILRLRGPAERAGVMPLLVRIPGDEARALWLRSLDPETERHDVVLAAATSATRQKRADVGLAKCLLRVLADKRAGPDRRALVLEALGWMQTPAAVLVLTKARLGEHWVEAAARALALGRRATVKSIPPLLDLLEHESLAPRVHAWESLVRLTHRDLPVEAAPWRAWWAQQDRTKLPARPTMKAAGDAAGKGPNARYAAKAPLHVPHYYGIPIPKRGSKVVFCLDASQSMYGHGIDQARRELKKTLMDLPATHAFEIIVFNAKVMPWARRLAAAHPVQKHLAIQYLDSIEPTSYTNLYDSVELAFGYAGRGPRAVVQPAVLESIFLLSDGAPNRGRFRHEKRVVEHIAKLSGKGVPVHTIGAGEEVFPLLRSIARVTGGTFVDAFD